MTATITDLIAQAGFNDTFKHMPNGGIGEGKVFAYCFNGDFDPGYLMSELEARNREGLKDVVIATTLRAALGLSNDQRELAGAEASAFLAGVHEQILCYNPQGSGGAATNFGLVGLRLPVRNSGYEDAHPGHGSFCFRIGDGANTSVVKSRVIRKAGTISEIIAWCKTKRTSAGGTYVLTVSVTNRAGVTRNLLSTASYNLLGMTTVTLAVLTLTATTADRNIEPGETLTVTATSNNIDLQAGDLIVEAGWVPR